MSMFRTNFSISCELTTRKSILLQNFVYTTSFKTISNWNTFSLFSQWKFVCFSSSSSTSDDDLLKNKINIPPAQLLSCHQKINPFWKYVHIPKFYFEKKKFRLLNKLLYRILSHTQKRRWTLFQNRLTSLRRILFNLRPDLWNIDSGQRKNFGLALFSLLYTYTYI